MISPVRISPSLVGRLFCASLASLSIGGGAALAQAPAQPVTAVAQPPQSALVSRGEYLTRAADCVVCHTKAGGKPFAGGLAFNTAFGTMFASNITPDARTGIGGWTDDQFAKAVRQGVRPDGQRLYPSMPYTSYVKLTDDDIKAIHAYINTLPAVNQQTPAIQMGFPYNQRWLMAGWNLLNFKNAGFTAETDKTAQYNRGAYVATALGHCSECHTPRNLTMGLKSNKPLAGAMVDGWRAFNISPDPKAGIGSWSAADLTRYLHSGALPGKANAGGAMGDVIGHSLRYLSDADMAALVVYLQAQPKQGGASHDRFSFGKPSDDLDTAIRGFPTGKVVSGAVLFSGNCTSCHGDNGGGIGKDGYYPSLFHNSVTGAPTSANLIQVVLHGVHRTNDSGAEIVMPGFADQMTDDQIASLANYVTTQFGNPKLHTSPHDVTVIRADKVAVIPGGLLIGAGVLGALIAASLLILWLRHPRSATLAH